MPRPRARRSAPLASLSDLAYTRPDAIERATRGLALVARPAVRTRVERRLDAGVIASLAHDLAALRSTSGGDTVALRRQKSATTSARGATQSAESWLASIRRSARSRNVPAATRRALGVGAVGAADTREALAATVRAVATELDSPATRELLGRLPEDAAAGHALADALGAAVRAAGTARGARTDTTRTRDETQSAVETGLRAISLAGTDEYWKPADRALHDAFMALTEVRAKKTKKGAGGAAGGTGGTGGAAG